MPVDRGSIDGQLRDIGEGERWWEQREFRDLPHILNSDERIQGLVTGMLVARRRPRLMPNSPWLIVATDQRLLCLKQERFGRKQVDVRGDQITGVRHRSRLRSYQITVETPQGKYRIRIAKTDAFRFIGALSPLVPRPAIHDVSAPALLPGISTITAVPGLPGLVSRIARLPAPDYATRADLARLESTVDRLEGEVERLQQQVEFLENLLQKRPGEVHS